MIIQNVPDVQRLFIEGHLYLETDGLAEVMRDLGEPAPPKYIGMPIAGEKGMVVLRFHLVGGGPRGWQYEYRYTGKGVTR